MNKNQETIADIVAWLRTPREGENGYLAVWRDEIADRIEAAHKREAATAENSSAVGNGAKMREALEKAADTIQGFICGQASREKNRDTLAIIRSALGTAPEGGKQ